MIFNLICSTVYFRRRPICPTNTIHWTNVDLLLDHRLGRWTNINPALRHHLVFSMTVCEPGSKMYCWSTVLHSVPTLIYFMFSMIVCDTGRRCPSQEAYARKRTTISICKLWKTVFDTSFGLICYSTNIFLKEPENLTSGNPLPHPFFSVRVSKLLCAIILSLFSDLHQVNVDLGILSTKKSIARWIKR